MHKVLEELLSLRDRTALVTGGTSGIGTMIARALLLGGAKVLVTGRKKERADSVAEELGQFGPCEGMSADLSTKAGRETFIGEVVERAPSLSMLVNNAGVTAHNELGHYTEQQFDDVYGLNVKTPFMLMQAFRPLLKANATVERPAQVINVGSIAGIVTSTPNSFAYGASKSALHHLTRVMARKLADDHIHVNAIVPGLFPSRMSAWIMDDAATRQQALGGIPIRRPGGEDDIAVLVIAIAASRYMTGDLVVLDGGASL